ncbi:MAG: hypothetical protein COA67_12440 [Lutibacter sp.]|nr:MAG: hypothetical protein COA67_12440 [Lutibacter sp.]
MNFSRKTLHKRHRLSHQQIDTWLGENKSKEFIQEKMRRLKMVKNFLSVTDLLKENKVSFINFKGPLLSHRIYNDASVRYMRDVDVLVDKVVIEEVLELLLKNGYHLMDGVFWPKTKVKQQVLVNTLHHLAFYNKELGFCVEVHWMLTQMLPISKDKMQGIIKNNLTEATIFNRTFTVFTKEFELLYLLIHGSSHGWQRLKWLVDINDYPIEDIDMVVFEKLVKQFKAGRIINQTNFLLNKYFQSSLPISSIDRLPNHFIKFAVDSIESDIQRTKKRSLQSFRNKATLFPGIYYKLKMIRYFDFMLFWRIAHN